MVKNRYTRNMAETVSAQAYCKMLLHAAKYPHCAVNGVLLAEKPKSKESRNIKFVDAVPLFHLSLSLAPMMEVALMHIDDYCRQNNLIIAGYYHANENHDDCSPKPLAKRICSKIQDNNSHTDTCLFMIDNSAMSMDCPKEAFHLFKQGSRDWERKSARETLEAGCLSIMEGLLQSNKQMNIVDFDNHLDDLSKDWRNTDINELLTHYS